jgi:predicted nucleotidyltransferase
MIFKNAVLNIFPNKTAVKLLGALSNLDGMHSGRALARLAVVNHQSCSLALKKLTALGVIKRDGGGRSALYGINRENVVVKKIIEPLFKAAGSLKDELGGDLSGLAGPETASIILFGSMAKGSETSGSDIDVMIVVKSAGNKRTAADRLAKEAGFFIGKYGNVISPAILSEPEFKREYKKKTGLIMNIFRSGTVIYGKNMGELVK